MAVSNPFAQRDRLNTVASSLSEDVSEDEQSDEDFEEEKENGNHIPAGGLMSIKLLVFPVLT